MHPNISHSLYDKKDKAVDNKQWPLNDKESDE